MPGPRKPQAERVTDKGLPKRTPKVVQPEGAPAPARTGSLDKDDLRRRLGSFHQAAKEGRRDVEAEIAGSTGSLALADHEGVTTGTAGHESTSTAPATGTAHDTGTGQAGGRTDRRNGETGDTVEEARS